MYILGVAELVSDGVSVVFVKMFSSRGHPRPPGATMQKRNMWGSMTPHQLLLTGFPY